LPESAFNAPQVRNVGFEALLRHRVRSVRPIVANRETPSPSWASFPFKVLPDGETNPRLARRTGLLLPRPLSREKRSHAASSVSTPVIDERSRRTAADREAQPTPKRWWASHLGGLSAVKR
jgi:hypothetical protein